MTETESDDTANCPICEKRFDHTNDIGEHTYCLRCLVEKHGWDRPRVGNDDEPAVISKWWRNGYRPPDDPDEWKHIYDYGIDAECPDCGPPIFLKLGPTEILEPYVMEYLSEPPSEGWTEGHNQPVCLSCGMCKWTDVAEWERIRADLENAV